LEFFVAWVEYDEADFTAGELVDASCTVEGFHPRESNGWWLGPRLSLACTASEVQTNIAIRFATEELDATLESLLDEASLQLRFNAATGWMGLSYSTEFSLRDEDEALVLLQLTAELPPSQNPSEVDLGAPSWMEDASGWTAPFDHVVARVDGCPSRAGAARRDNLVEMPWVVELRAGDATAVLHDRTSGSITSATGNYAIFVESAVTSVEQNPEATGGTDLASVLVVRDRS
jgi:hypothetical protein